MSFEKHEQPGHYIVDSHADIEDAVRDFAHLDEDDDLDIFEGIPEDIEDETAYIIGLKIVDPDVVITFAFNVDDLSSLHKELKVR